MPKLTLNQAQRRADSSVRQLSDLLLGHENAAQAEIARVFRGWIPPVVAARVPTIRNNADLRASWVDNHTAAILATTPVVRRMATACTTNIVATMRRELRLAEEALGARAAGRTDAAMAAIDPASTTATLITGYVNGQGPYRALYRAAQTAALSRADTVEELQELLFGVRGAWWQAARGMQDQARRVSIGLANQIRLDAMAAFNRD